jgi:hypothetical protein
MTLRLVLSVALGAALALPTSARAHCDARDGPVARSAGRALQGGDPAPVLAWVRPADEAELRAAFQKARAERQQGGEARRLADTAFLETAVRLHRAGEGAPFTGLAPAGRDPGPAVTAADRAVASGDGAEVERLLRAAAERGLQRRLAAVRARQPPSADVAAGRAWVAAYVEWVHYVEGAFQALGAESTGAEGARSAPSPGATPEAQADRAAVPRPHGAHPH